MISKTKGVSVILCCYNSASRIEPTLKHLASQQINPDYSCEVILVDNNSKDNIIDVAKHLWKAYNTNIDLRLIKEPKPGLTYARTKGVTESNYNLLLYCDDDNWLCDTYVQTAIDIMESNKDIGALGGWCEAVFEDEKPDWFDTYSRFYAVSKQGNISGDITDKKGCLYGAGMVIRKSQWNELKTCGFINILSDRKGVNLSSGGDTEYTYALRLLGYKIWYDERLYFKHFMTNQRLSLNYLSRIRKAMAYSNFILWPYLDLLSDDKTNSRNHLKLARSGIPKHPIKHFKLLITGTFEQKELVKFYYRNLYYFFTKFSEYKANKAFIKNWLLNKK